MLQSACPRVRLIFSEGSRRGTDLVIHGPLNVGGAQGAVLGPCEVLINSPGVMHVAIATDDRLRYKPTIGASLR